MGHPERPPPQASRLDVCCCLRAQELPPPSPREGHLLRFFRKVYAPFLLHRATRVVVVSGRAGGWSSPPGGRGLLSPTLTSWSWAVGGSPRSGAEAGVGVAAGTQVQLECV